MDIVSETKQKMQKVLEVLKADLSTVRTGRAAPSLVENISVLVYGGSTRMKIMELATIHSSDPQTILITPFDASIAGEIQKGILEANVGLTPSSDGQSLRISIPPLSEERRQQLIKLMHQKLENGRVMVRQARHDALNDLKKQTEGMSEDEVDRIEKEIQKVTDDLTSEIDMIGKKKEDELLQI